MSEFPKTPGNDGSQELPRWIKESRWKYTKLDIQEMITVGRILHELLNDEGATGTSIGAKYGFSPALVSQYLERCDTALGGKVLRERSRWESYGKPTAFGMRVLEQINPIIELADRLGSTKHVSILRVASSNSILSYLLPGAVFAFNLLRPRLYPDREILITLVDCNYSEMIAGVTEGKYHLGIGWLADSFTRSTPATTSPDTLLLDDVRFEVAMPVQELTEAQPGIYSSLQQLFHKGKKQGGVLLDDILREIGTYNRSVAALRSGFFLRPPIFDCLREPGENHLGGSLR